MDLNKFNETLNRAEDNNELIPDEELTRIYKILNDKTKEMGFKIIVDTEYTKKYVKNDNSKYTHYIEFRPKETENQVVYEVRTENGDIKLHQEHSILDALLMSVTLDVIEIDMVSFE